MSKLFIKDRFATTPNTLLANPNITLRAKGLFAFIQGKPDKWSFSAERIAFENKEGLQSVRSALQELEKFGYLQRLKTKNDKGHWEIDYILYSDPKNPADEIPTLGNRPTETHTTENPTSGNPRLENHTNNSNTYIIKKDINKKSKKIDFSVFWDLYGKKINSKDSKLKWDKLSLADQEKIIDTLPNFKKGKDYQYLPNPTTYLNQQRWNDELNIISEIPNETPEQKELIERIEFAKSVKIH